MLHTQVCGRSSSTHDVAAGCFQGAGRIYLTFWAEMSIKASTFWENKDKYMQVPALLTTHPPKSSRFI